METTAYVLNAFAKTKRGGNPAGVVLNADGLKQREMQKISAKLGFSETAFVQKSSKADFKVRFFTLNKEVDLCGHATIATFYLLKQLGVIKDGKFTQEIKVGILGVEVRKNNVFMEQNLPEYSKLNEKRSTIANSLGVKENDLALTMPLVIASTGSRDILIPVKNHSALLSIKPKFSKLKQISKKTNTVGYHVFSLDTKSHYTAHCRDFAPLYGIREESATGSSSGALACYLFDYDIINKEQAKLLIFEQGYSMGSPSEILARLTIKGKQIRKVEVGGRAILIKKLELDLD